MKKKKCEIHATLPITCFEVPIIGDANLNLTADEIYKCLCSKAEVKEVLPDGKRINLDFTNYDKDNSIVTLPYKGEEVKVVTLPSKEEELKVTPLPFILDEEVKEEKVDTLEELIELVESSKITEEKISEEVKHIVDEVFDSQVKSEPATFGQISTVEDKVEVAETTVAETTKNYQVASRNNGKNNNYKKAKNNNRK